jgi:tRNA threonylcarbamoyladenosine biosynthesis protein TsaE
MPILDATSVEIFSHSPVQTRRVGMRLGALLQSGDVVCLAGDLGAGKTTLVQGIANGWGSLDPATSPTFVLVNFYRRPDRQVLHHLDAYRMKDALEAEDLDLDLMLEEGPLVVEWPERIPGVLPVGHLWVGMRWLADDKRGMIFTPHGQRYEALLSQFRRITFGGF